MPHSTVLLKTENRSRVSADFLHRTIQKKNNTGLPNQLKEGVEQLSGISMDDVKVHYNSPRPAQLQALAYAQGTDIHVGPGQEKHLPHEAWHVVQQKQGRVRPTIQLKEGVPVNDDKELEREADHMGAKALQTKSKCSGGGGCGCSACGGGAPKEIKQFYKTPAQLMGIFQLKCDICGAKSHSTAKCTKTKKEKEGGDPPAFRIVSRNGCYDDGDCTNRVSGADFCHNCGESGGTHVSWTYSYGEQQKTFCFPCSFLGKDEQKAKVKMETSAKSSMKESVIA